MVQNVVKGIYRICQHIDIIGLIGSQWLPLWEQCPVGTPETCSEQCFAAVGVLPQPNTGKTMPAPSPDVSRVTLGEVSSRVKG